MLGFQKSLFSYDGDYLMYEGKFVCRFKHNKKDKADFVKFLCANFTVEEYFKLVSYDSKTGNRGMAPVTAMETKGYVSKTVRDAITAYGYAPTIEGKKQWLSDVDARRSTVR